MSPAGTRFVRTRLVAGGLVLGGLLALLTLAAPAQAQLPAPGPPSGDGIQPVVIADNPTCSTLDPGTTELKVEPVVDGTYSDGTLTVTIDVRDTALGQVFDWSSNIGIDSIFVKGGNDGNFYLYDPPMESKDDTALHAPVNPQNNMFFGLSHISFCYDVQASIKVDKTGDELSKVGDKVKYDFKITNDGDVTLNLVSITDTLLGDLADDAPAACDTLAAGAMCTFSVEREVQAGDPDPLPNTVTVSYSGMVGGQATTVTDSDDHSVNLFQPSVTIDKTGDTLSKVGDSVNYTIKVENTSSADSPNLTCDVTDTLLGMLADDINLAPGDDQVINTSRVVLAGDPDPLVNTATVDCKVDGFPNQLSASDSHSVNLFQPAVMVVKGGPAEATEGDTITYTYTITNTSSMDSPNLILESVMDDKVGDLTMAATTAGCGELAPSASCNFTANFSIPMGTPSPLVNVVTVDYHPKGFDNEVKDSDDHSVVVKEKFEGCTPGFWKTHPEAWGPTGFSPGDTLESVFDVPNAFGLDTKTLLQALSFDGGPTLKDAAKILLRAGVAALLNSAHPDVDYPLTTAQVIAKVNAALASDSRAKMINLAEKLDEKNNAGCPLS